MSSSTAPVAAARAARAAARGMNSMRHEVFFFRPAEHSYAYASAFADMDAPLSLAQLAKPYGGLGERFRASPLSLLV